MAGTYRPGAFTSRDDTYQSKGSMQHGRTTYGQHRQQKNAAAAAAASGSSSGSGSASRTAEVDRMKEQAQMARVKETEPVEDPTPAPLFGLPIKMNRARDPVHSMITKVLGNYDEVKGLVSSTGKAPYTSYLGVVELPNTPVRLKSQGDLFPPLHKVVDNDRDKAREREKLKERERQQVPPPPQPKDGRPVDKRPTASSQQQQHNNNGAFPSSSKPKVKDPQARDNVFDKFLTNDSNSSSGSTEPAGRSRKDSKSGERHKDRGKDRGARTSTSSDRSEGSAKHKLHRAESRDRRSASLEKDRRSRDRDVARGDRPPSLSDAKSAGSQDGGPPSRPTPDTNADSQKRSASSGATGRTTPSTTPKSSKTGPATGSKSPTRRSIDRQDSAESRSSVSSETSNSGQKSATGKGGSSSTSNKPTSEPTFVKPLNAVSNGLVRRKEGSSSSSSGDNAGKPDKRPKLLMPKPSHGPSSLSVERILQEMSFDQPPLTAIETPKKDLDSRFPFPTLAKDGHTSKSAAAAAAATTERASSRAPPARSPATAPAGAASSAPGTVSKHRAQPMGATDHGSSALSTKDVEPVSVTLENDLEVSSDSDTEEKQTTSETTTKPRRHSSTTESRHRDRRSPKPKVKKSSMSDSSDSSSSGSDSSDSGSDSESSSSDNEEEKEPEEVIRKPKSPTPPPPPPPPVPPARTWALENWTTTQPSGLPGSEALAAGGKMGGDSLNFIPDNDDIIDMIIQDKIPEPSPEARIDNIIDKKSSLKVGNDNGIRLTISIGGKGGKGESTSTVSSSKASPRSRSDKTPPRAAGKSPSNAKSSSSSRSGVGQSPGRRGRKSSKQQTPQAKPANVEKEVTPVPKPSPKMSPKPKPSPKTATSKASSTKAASTVAAKGSPAAAEPSKAKTLSRKDSFKTSKSSPRVVAQKTPPRSSTTTDKKPGGGTPKSKRKTQFVSKEILSSDSSSSDEDMDVDVTSVTPVKMKPPTPRAQSPATSVKGKDTKSTGSSNSSSSTTAKGSTKSGRTKSGGGGSANTTPVKKAPTPPPPQPPKIFSSSSDSSSSSSEGEISDDEKENEPAAKKPVPPPAAAAQQQGRPKLAVTTTLEVEDVFDTIFQDQLLSPIPPSRSNPVQAPAAPPPAVVQPASIASRKSSLTRLSTSSTTSSIVHPVTEAPRKKQPSPRPPGASPAGSPSSSSAESGSDSGSESDSSDSGSSSHSTSRGSSRASSRASSQASSRASSRAASPAAKAPSVTSCTVTATTSVSSSTCTLPNTAGGAGAGVAPTPAAAGITHGPDGKPSIIVRLDLALIDHYGPPLSSASSSMSAMSSCTASTSSSSSNLLPPPPPRDVETINRKPVAVVEPQQSHVDKSVPDIKLEPASVSRDHLGHPGPLLPLRHKDQTHMDTAAMAMTSHAAPALASTHAANKEVSYRKERDTILSKIIKDERKPPQTKIPKRKNADPHPTEYKRARTEHRSSSSRGTPSGRTPTRGTPSQNTPKRGDNVAEREMVSHEDDHEWDRKYPARSADRDRRAGSCSSSSSSHHSERGAKRPKHDTHDADRGSRGARDRDRGRDRERDRERDRQRAVHSDWNPNTDDTGEIGAEGSSYSRHANHPAASQWSALAAGLDGGEWPPERSGNTGEGPERVDRRHDWRRQERQDRERQERQEKKETVETADHYLSEARRLKHHADTLMDRLAKSLMYVEAVLSFIQCGNAMEHDRISEPNKYVTMYKDTFSLIRHINKFRGSHDGDVNDKEKKLSVLSLRIQGLLCLKLFNLKKTETTNLKRAIDEHTRNASTASRPQAPSPYQTNWNRSTGTPSPMSPTPSPAGSVGSVGSVLSPQGSNNGDHRNHTAATTTTGAANNGAGASVSVPTRIHQITQNYISHVHNLVQCHELWETADQQAAEFPEFFHELDCESVQLSLHSSIPDLVSYVRTGLRRLNSDT